MEKCLEADIYSQKVQFGNTVLILPVTLKDIIASGATINDVDINPDTQIIDMSSGYSVSIIWGEPTSKDIDLYVYRSGHSSFKITIDLETNA